MLKTKNYFYQHLPEKLKLNSIVTVFGHKSFVHENINGLFESYERLEFLGDAVLQLIISQKLFKKFPDFTEGDLSKMRSALVNEQILSQLFSVLNLENYILLGRGELKENGHLKTSIQSNVYEAILGSLYVEEGMESAEAFLDETIRLFEQKFNKVFFSIDITKSFDAKTKLQELVMKKYQTLPKYNIKEVNGSMFEITLEIDKQQVGKVQNASKKKGMQVLAKKILEKNIL